MIIHDIPQHTAAWYEARLGLVTASRVKDIVTPTGKISTAKQRQNYLYELVAEKITGAPADTFVTADMMRGQQEEPLARELYSEAYSPVCEAGFITEDKWGFTIGYSPDGLVGEDGLIEIKSRKGFYQIETLITGQMPDEYYAQVQAGLLVTGRKWCDFVSFSADLPIFVQRIYPAEEYQQAILTGVAALYKDLEDHMQKILGAA